MQSIATTTDDLKSRINAAEIHVFTLSGRMEATQVPGAEELLTRLTEIILDCRLRLANRDQLRFFKGCEADGMRAWRLSAYVPEWMDREKD